VTIWVGRYAFSAVRPESGKIRERSLSHQVSRVGTGLLQPEENHEQEHRRKVALLTGASGGLRKSTACYLAKLGATVGRKPKPHLGKQSHNAGGDLQGRAHAHSHFSFALE
jgi:hypothetical protein